MHKFCEFCKNNWLQYVILYYYQFIKLKNAKIQGA